MKVRLLGVVVVVLCMGAWPAAAQVAESCTYDATAKQVAAVIAPGGEATLQVVGGEIRFGAVPQACGAATTANTDLITVAAHAGSSEQLVLDQRTGTFGPGVEVEPNTPEIEIEATLEETDALIVYLTEGDDDVAPGQNGIGLFGDGDVDVTFPGGTPPSFPIAFHALGGNDFVNGRGQFGAGLAYLGPLTIDGGPGDDELLRGSFEPDVVDGGPGNDVLDGQNGGDLMEGGAGNDVFTAGDGDDRLVGGPGADSFVGNFGNDTILALDLGADVEIDGGPGTDTAYYDPALDPAPLFVENAVGEDTTAPTVSCEPADGAWHAGDVAVACTAEDAETGVPDPGDEAFELGTAVPAGTETANAPTATRSVCNGIGLCAQAGPVTGNRVDKRPPANPTGVHSTDHTVGKWSRDREISVVFTPAVDGGSGVDGISYSWTTAATSAPDQVKDAEQTATALTSPTLGDGRWFLHVRTLDNVGRWSDPDHHGPFLVDGERPRVRALIAAGRVGQQLILRYRTADNSGRTGERVTVLRNGSVVVSWSRPQAAAQWATIQSVPWTARNRGAYSLCVLARDPAGNTRSDCAPVTVRR
jgi:RTX calcium-binding nonapeptide repeat (4 copies)